MFLATMVPCSASSLLFSLCILGILIHAYNLTPKYCINVYFQLYSGYLLNVQLEITISPQYLPLLLYFKTL